MKKIILKSMLMCMAVFLCVVCWVNISRQMYFFQEKENYQVICGLEQLVYSDLLSGGDSKEFMEGCYFIEEDRQIEGIVHRSAFVILVGENIDSDILFPSFNRLAYDDVSGCLLDAGTLYELFGTTDAFGQTVKYNGREYAVRGVLELNIPLMVVSCKFEEDQRVDGLVLNTADEWYRNQYMELLGSLYGPIESSYYLTDYISLSRWMDTPSRWSDFEFWGSHFDNLKLRLEHIFFENKDITEQVCLRKSFPVMGLRIALAFLAAGLAAGLYKMAANALSGSNKR